MTEEELYQKIIDKYPVYSKFSKEKLLPLWLKKYPQYARQITQKQPTLDEKIFAIPSAGIRSALQGKGYQRGVMNYKTTPKFQDLALEKLAPRTSDVLTNYIGGMFPSLMGYAADTATNPAEILMALVGGQAIKKLAPTEFGQWVEKELTYPLENLAKDIKYSRIKPQDAAQRAKDLLVKVLQPSKSQLATGNLETLEDPQMIEESVRYVKPVKTFRELSRTFGKAKRGNIAQVNEIIRKNDFSVARDEILKPLSEAIGKAKNDPLVDDSDIVAMENVYNEWRAKLGKNTNRSELQRLKIKLNKIVTPLLKKIKNKEPIQEQPGTAQAKEYIRQAMKPAIEGNDPVEAFGIQTANKPWEGLRAAQSASRNQWNLERKAPEPTLLEKIPVVRPIIDILSGRPRFGAYDAMREALSRERSLGKVTQEIADLYEISQRGVTQPAPNYSKAIQGIFGQGKRLLSSPGQVKPQPIQPMIRVNVPKNTPPIEPLPAGAGITIDPRSVEYNKIFENVPIEGEGFTAYPKSVGEAALMKQKMDMLKKAREMAKFRLYEKGKQFGRIYKEGD
jgi:hypothetical protein